LLRGCSSLCCTNQPIHALLWMQVGCLGMAGMPYPPKVVQRSLLHHQPIHTLLWVQWWLPEYGRDAIPS
ncbi:hypothetical protein, partial [Leyella stercorea]|uniref:hypothetical protein n=1 Tax=Leyella stercorea TaxID=363265 RepID=UPI00266C3F56